MAQRSALIGRYAEATLNGTLVALLYDWSAKAKGKTLDLTAHGDKWRYLVPLPSEWTFTAKSFVVPASAAHLIHALFAANTLPVLVTVAGYSGSASGGTKIFEGQGYVSMAELLAPMEMATQGFEIDGHGPPTVGVS